MAWKSSIITVSAERYSSSLTTNHSYQCLKKDIATLSQHIQCILLKIHQYRVQIIYKPGPEIFIADWLSWHNHIEGKDKPIKDMDISIDAIQSTTDIPGCISMAQIQQASAQDDHLQCLNSFIITGWPSTKDKLHSDLKPYWLYRQAGSNRWNSVERQAYSHTK